MASMNDFAQKVYEHLKSNPEGFDMTEPCHCIAGEAQFLETGEYNVNWDSHTLAKRLGLPNDNIFWYSDIFEKSAPEIAEIFRQTIEDQDQMIDHTYQEDGQ